MYECKCKCKWSEVPFNPPNCAASPGKKMKTLLNQVFSQENVSKSEVTIFLVHEKNWKSKYCWRKNILYQPSHVWNHITGNRSFALSFLVHGFLTRSPTCARKPQESRCTISGNRCHQCKSLHLQWNKWIHISKHHHCHHHHHHHDHQSTGKHQHFKGFWPELIDYFQLTITAFKKEM